MRLDRLHPGAWYRYQVGCDTYGWSEEKTFRAPGTDMGHDRAWSFLATSDTGRCAHMMKPAKSAHCLELVRL